MFTARSTAQAQRLQRDWVQPVGADIIRPDQTDDGRRKLNCMAAVHRQEGMEHAQMDKVIVRADSNLLSHFVSYP